MRNPELAVEAEDGGIAVEPANGAWECLADDAALAQAMAAQENEQAEIAAGEGLNDPFQVGVGSRANAQGDGMSSLNHEKLLDSWWRVGSLANDEPRLPHVAEQIEEFLGKGASSFHLLARSIGRHEFGNPLRIESSRFARVGGVWKPWRSLAVPTRPGYVAVRANIIKIRTGP